MTMRELVDLRGQAVGRMLRSLFVGIIAVGASVIFIKSTPAYSQSGQQLPGIVVEGGQGTSASASVDENVNEKDSVLADPKSVGNSVTITTEDILQSGATNSQTLFAGETSVRAGGTMPSSTKIYVNGLEETLLNVQIDGARQPQRSGFHHNNNNLVDPEILRSVAIDAGASGADVGPHALGGSIRYRTINPADLLNSGQTLGAFAKASYNFNSEEFAKSVAVYGMQSGFEALFYGKWTDGDNYEDGDGNEVIGTDVGLTDYLGKFAYEAPTGHRFAFSGQQTTDDGIRPFRNNFAVSFIPDQFSFQEIQRETYTFEYTTTKPTKYFDPEVSVYYNKNTWHRPHPDNPQPFTTGVPPFFVGLSCDPGQVTFFCVAYGDATIESVGGKVQNTLQVGSGKLTVGGDYYKEESESDHGGGSQVLSETGRNFGLFTQYRAAVADNLDISVGTRYDWHRFEGADGQTFSTSGASPNISADFKITEGLKIKGAYGRSFGGIPLSEVILMREDVGFGFLPAAGIIPQYADDIKEQYGEQGRIGVAFEQNGFNAEAYYFRTTIQSAIEPSSSTQDLEITNFGNVRTKGFNVAVSYETDNAKLAAKFQRTETEVDDRAVSPADWFLSTPQGDIFTLSGHYKFAEQGLVFGFLSQWALDYEDSADVIAGGGASAAPLGTLEGYNVHNVFAEWNPTFAEEFTFRLDGLNVFDKQYIDRSSAIVPGNDPLFSPGRTIILSGKVKY